MSVVITLEDIQAYAEVDYIINHMNEKYIEKVPAKLLKFFSDFKAPNHEIKINPYIPLENQGLKRFTLEIIALLHLKYWCEDEARKQELYDIMLRNQEKLDEQMKEKYSVEKLFNNEPNTSISEENIEKEDFSKPRVVQRYSTYTQDNNDIQDYTDVVSENSSDTLEQHNNLPSNDNSEIKFGFFQKILNIFRKNKK